MSDDQNLEQNSSVPQVSPALVTMTQAEFDEKIKAVKAKEREKFERSDASHASSNQSYGAQADIDKIVEQRVEQRFDNFKRETERKAHEATIQAMANRVLSSWNAKMAAGKDKYPDFDTVMKDLNVIQEYPELVQLTNELDNTDDVMYELAKNDVAREAISSAFSKSPERALKMLMKTSQSIKDNQSAKANFQHNKSTTQLKPSATGVDNGKRTMNDLREYVKKFG